ncbi:MAG: tRNA (adenosine(37)-N6)-threonylcarbamoyltransferase complex ATPase subunit type 1 TsaE [Spiroplasma sp.]|nr:tRNA (adenosine(37)-N6)-threonylcarbamoyltransferase complex ATPase subunit type 1 TsaE [Spiroplasma sp.]
MKKSYHLKTLTDTKKIALAISKIAKANIYLLLSGPLASGKTQLTKFIGLNLGVQEVINSPTFVILNQYQTNQPWKLIHIDAYRLNKTSNFQEYFELTINNFTIIEWPEQITWDFSKLKTITINFEVKNNDRLITITTNNLTKQELKL